MKRRLLLQAGTALLPLGWACRAQAHNMAGAVRPPLPVPDIAVRMDNGQSLRLPALLTGRATALQLMFTGCSAICPIQGALFAQVQAALPRNASPLQLLSASIDPMADDPAALSAWLARHGSGPHWRALSPSPGSLDRWLDFLAGRVAGPDRHTAQVYFFDRQARLVLRTADFPPAQDTARLLTQLAAAG